MTMEEAKEILTHNWTRVDNPNYSESELDEAFFMAIDALKQTTWIPVWERLPDDDGEYLVCYENGYREDHSFPEIGIQSFDVNCNGFGEWIDYYHPETLGFVDSDWSEIKVKAWMPLPLVYQGE